jgi:hypothetical protein
MSRAAARLFGPGLLLAIVALAMQLAAASIVPFRPAPVAGLDRLVAASICHTDTGGAPRHRAPDCVLCPLCQAIAHAGVPLHPGFAALPAPVAAAARLVSLPPARAPPLRRIAAAAPRGPPDLT